MKRSEIRALIEQATEADRLDFLAGDLPMNPDPRDYALLDSIAGLLIQATEDDRRAVKAEQEVREAEERAAGYRVDAEEARTAARARRAAAEHLLLMWEE